MAKYRPPLWSSKIYGEPHGAWESTVSVAPTNGKPAKPKVTNTRCAGQLPSLVPLIR
jgi:hypothetical protein